MRFTAALVAALAADSVVASSWFGKAAYNKWHETELERWLSDHDIPYPKAADRKDLENLVKANWNTRVGSPYASWDTPQLQAYLNAKGDDAKKTAEGVKKDTKDTKNSLVDRVKASWYETEDQALESYHNVRDWIFDTWTESQLKAFLDRHGIPNPQPRTRDTLLKTARENYQSVATKAGETAAYPGNWLYETWSDSDLKAWLDERGIPAPKPSKRDKLVATVRRNARAARHSIGAIPSSVSSAAASATQSISDAVFDTWSDSQIKEWADRNGINVPQGSKRNELIALARKHQAKLAASTDAAASSASSMVNAATTSAGNAYARATDEAAYARDGIYGYVSSCIDWVKHQIGLGIQDAKVAAASASASASSASLHASASVKSSSSEASKAAKKAAHAAAETASSVKHRAEEATQRATDYVKEEL